MLYAAYGSNLNIAQMKRRCRDAVIVGKVFMPGWRLVFRRVADIERAHGASVPLGIWSISMRDREALDRYEGVAMGLYRREYIRLPKTAGPVLAGKQALVYVMNEDGYSLPPQSYFDTIVQGYEDFGFDRALLFEALRYTTDQMEDDYV